MKMKLNHLLDEVKGDGSRIYYRKVPNVPVHVLIVVLLFLLIRH